MYVCMYVCMYVWFILVEVRDPKISSQFLSSTAETGTWGAPAARR